MAKRRGRGVLKGGIGYPGAKANTSIGLMESVDDALRDDEAREGVSKSAILNYLIRTRATVSKAAIERDIARAKRQLAARKTAARRDRWKPVLDK